MISKNKNGVSIKSLPNGYLAIDPESISWVVSKNKRDLDDYEFEQELLNQRIDAIKQDRATIYLDQFEIQITEKCNLRCKYCYVPNSYKTSRTCLSISEFDIIIKKIEEFSCNEKRKPRIHLHGGEPGLCIELVKYAINKYRNSFEFALQTNGCTIEISDLIWLVQNNVDVGISIDGEKVINEKIRVNADTEKIIESIKTIKQYSVNSPNILCTISDESVCGIFDLCCYLYDIGVYSISMNPVTPYLPHTTENTPNESLLIEEYTKCVDFALDKTINSPDKPLFINNMEAIAISILTSRSASYCEMFPCGAGRHMAVINSLGDLYPCSGLISNQNYNCGSVFSNNSILELLSSTPVKKIQNRKIEEIEPCNNCLYRQICGANCPVPFINENDDLKHKSFWCHFRHSLIDHVFNNTIENTNNILNYISYETRISLFNSQVSIT